MDSHGSHIHTTSCIPILCRFKSKTYWIVCISSHLIYDRPITPGLQSCHSALLHHIRARILFFMSLSQSEFLSIFLSVFPYDEHHWSACSLLTEHLLHVEYGEALISSFYTSSLSVNESRCVQWCTNQALVDMDAKKKKNRTDLFELAFCGAWQHHFQMFGKLPLSHCVDTTSHLLHLWITM